MIFHFIPKVKSKIQWNFELLLFSKYISLIIFRKELSTGKIVNDRVYLNTLIFNRITLRNINIIIRYNCTIIISVNHLSYNTSETRGKKFGPKTIYKHEPDSYFVRTKRKQHGAWLDAWPSCLLLWLEKWADRTTMLIRLLVLFQGEIRWKIINSNKKVNKFEK